MAVRTFVKVEWKGGEANKRFRQGARLGVQKAANIILHEALRLIEDTPKTGIVYGTHQASAPGEAPATHYGDLVAGFRLETFQDGFRVNVVNRSRHGELLEFGTRHMEPRPFMTPAAQNTKKQGLAAIAEEIRKATSYTPRS